MPKPAAMPVMKNAGGPPIGACSAPKAKNDANCGAVGRGRVRVPAEQVESVAAEADLEHAQVLDAREGRVERELAQPAGQAQPADVAGDREAVDIDFPRGRGRKNGRET